VLLLLKACVCARRLCCRYVKDDPSAAPKRSRPSSYPEAPPNNYPGAFAPPAAPAPAPYGHAPFNGMPAAAPAPAAVAPMQPRGYAPISNTKDNPPCNTLFIGNLGDATNEAEMRSLFRWEARWVAGGGQMAGRQGGREVSWLAWRLGSCAAAEAGCGAHSASTGGPDRLAACLASLVASRSPACVSTAAHLPACLPACLPAAAATSLGSSSSSWCGARRGCPASSSSQTSRQQWRYTMRSRGPSFPPRTGGA
jgi:hypothetical protein